LIIISRHFFIRSGLVSDAASSVSIGIENPTIVRIPITFRKPMISSSAAGKELVRSRCRRRCDVGDCGARGPADRSGPLAVHRNALAVVERLSGHHVTGALLAADRQAPAIRTIISGRTSARPDAAIDSGIDAAVVLASIDAGTRSRVDAVESLAVLLRDRHAVRAVPLKAIGTLPGRRRV
jgi:hypothetical protein